MIRHALTVISNFRKKHPIFDAFVWASLLACATYIGGYSDYFKAWLWNLLPITIGGLDANWWRAFGFTICASLVAWGLGAGIGYALGVFAAAARVSIGPEIKMRRWFGISIDVFYRFLYIIPFVLTANITYNIAFAWQDKFGAPRCVSGIAMILVAGAALGGYRVFIAVYSSVSEAKFESVVLSRSLFSQGRRDGSRVLGLRQSIGLVLRLRDCEILMFSRSLEDAFHLSIVAVMIVESILPAFYENFLPQSGFSPAYFGGVGRMVINAQQSLNPRQISGILWLVLIYDGIVTAIIRAGCAYFWHRYYHQQQKEVA